MEEDEVANQLTTLAFSFFFSFSRFEFALKENGYLKSRVPGANAEPGWEKFVNDNHWTFEPSQEYQCLLDLSPERQIVADGGGLTWRPVGLDGCYSSLGKGVRLLSTVRNNLFHGGKHGGSGWDDPERTRMLLTASLALLDQLAVLGRFESDYRRVY